MKNLFIVLLSLATLGINAQSFKNTCTDSRCIEPLMPNGYYSDYAYPNFVPCNINDVDLSKEGEAQRRIKTYKYGAHTYQVYIAKNGTWKLLGSFFMCAKHSGKTLYFKPGSRFAIGTDNNQPFELKINQPKQWKVK